MATDDEGDKDKDVPSGEPVPRLPVRASIYIDVDGTVHFGALFEGLVPVANALGRLSASNLPPAADALARLAPAHPNGVPESDQSALDVNPEKGSRTDPLGSQRASEDD